VALGLGGDVELELDWNGMELSGDLSLFFSLFSVGVLLPSSLRVV